MEKFFTDERFSILAIPAILAILAIGAVAQQFPTLSYETQVFNQVTGPVVSPVPQAGVPLSSNVCKNPNTMCAIQNTGMGSHLFKFCIVGGTVAGFDMWAEGSNDTTVTSGQFTPANWIQISPEATAPLGTVGCGTLQAAGYFKFLRLHLGTLTGAGATISAWYAGIGTALNSDPILQNSGSQNTTFVPSIPAVFGPKSTPLTLSTATIAIYALAASNPNLVPVFVSLTCPGESGPMIYEIPANDGRVYPIGGTVGMQCNGPSTIACSTSATAAVDPANACLITVASKNFLSIRTQINFAGTAGATSLQRPD